MLSGRYLYGPLDLDHSALIVRYTTTEDIYTVVCIGGPPEYMLWYRRFTTDCCGTWPFRQGGTLMKHVGSLICSHHRPLLVGGFTCDSRVLRPLRGAKFCMLKRRELLLQRVFKAECVCSSHSYHHRTFFLFSARFFQAFKCLPYLLREGARQFFSSTWYIYIYIYFSFDCLPRFRFFLFSFVFFCFLSFFSIS